MEQSYRVVPVILTLLCSVLTSVEASPKMWKFVVRAPKRACKNAVITVALPRGAEKALAVQEGEILALETADGKERLPAQAEMEGETARLTFVIPDLAPGAERVYRLRRAPKSIAKEPVQVTQSGHDMEVRLGGAHFTTYATQLGPNKPFFYPILTPEGRSITRDWPMKEGENEKRDHPHHRGLWFTHGSVNGVDFWSEEKGAGKTVCTALEAPVSGPVYGRFRARTEWRTLDGKLLATDTREIRIIPLPNRDRLLDFAITLRPNGEPLVFGDTKEGMFGLRVAETLAPSRKLGGQMVNSRGDRNGAAWGKSAEWVDYFGPIGGQTYGVALFDTPGNLRHPQTWHARDYGLFCVNPFGLHDFGLGPEKAGDHTVPTNQTFTLRYRALFHQGDTETAAVGAQYAAYADPPEVAVELESR